EDAEARVRELERQLFDMEGRRTARELGLKKRTDEAEARVRELEQDYYLKARSVGFGWQARADMDTFTVPDGRVFRVGQRVRFVHGANRWRDEDRSEERRVGKECRSRRSPCQKKENIDKII